MFKNSVLKPVALIFSSFLLASDNVHSSQEFDLVGAFKNGVCEYMAVLNGTCRYSGEGELSTILSEDFFELVETSIPRYVQVYVKYGISMSRALDSLKSAKIGGLHVIDCADAVYLSQLAGFRCIMNDDNKFDAFINTKIKNFRGELFNSEEAETNFCPLCLICPMVESPESRNFFCHISQIEEREYYSFDEEKGGCALATFCNDTTSEDMGGSPSRFIGYSPYAIKHKDVGRFPAHWVFMIDHESCIHFMPGDNSQPTKLESVAHTLVDALNLDMSEEAANIGSEERKQVRKAILNSIKYKNNVEAVDSMIENACFFKPNVDQVLEYLQNTL